MIILFSCEKYPSRMITNTPSPSMLSYLWLKFTIVIFLCFLELRHVVIGCGHLHHAMWVPTILLWGASQTTITGNAKKNHGWWIWLPWQGMVKDFCRSKGSDSQVATENIYGLLTKCEQVNMAGYWSSFCYLHVLDQATNRQKKNRPISSHLDWASLVSKDLLFGKRTLFSCEMQRVIPSRKGSAILPAQVANHNTGFGSSCPLMELVIQ